MNTKAITTLFSTLAKRFEEEQEQLGALDAILGDGDHGVSMARGFAKAAEVVQASDSDDVGELFQEGGRALMSIIGGASGPLFAMVLLELGKASSGQSELTLAGFQSGVAGAYAAVHRLGKAEVGDKTMLDVLSPVSDAIKQADSFAEALTLASTTAQQAVLQSRDLAAKKGRAQYVQDAGVGHPDPGACSLAIIFETFAQVSHLEASANS